MTSRKLYAVLAAMLILLMILSACGATDTWAPAPTVAPTTEPTAAPPTEEPAAEPPGAGALTANPWQWTSFTGPEEQFDVEMPESYLLAFNDDGTVAIVADCNNAMGSYTEDAGSLTIEVGGMTRAMCPDGSRSDQFVTYLGAAARYLFQDGMLYIDLFADGGAMAFAPADPELMAGDGEGALAGASGLSPFPPAEIANDEGGAVLVTGEFDYTSAYVARHFTEPVAMLLNISRKVQGDYTQYVPKSGQIMGFLTRPLAPAPTAYEVVLPAQPGDASVDVDSNGKEDPGVQIYAMIVGSNIVGDSYLEQAEQFGFQSYLADPSTDQIREGTLLVYAPDDAQGFPSSAGDDGIFFTSDDPVVGLPAGYTLVTLSQDGTVSFDRSKEARMDILEAAAVQSPDFADQGILESYNSLIDVLKERYSYTELRGLDWEVIRQKYLPAVQAADEAGDFQSYFSALSEMAISLHDAHVFVQAADPSLSRGFIAASQESLAGSLGAALAELSDGRFVVIYLLPDGPAAVAGWEVGTEILSVDGVSIGEHIAARPLLDSVGNPEIIRLKQTERALTFPAGAETTIEYLQPGESEPRFAALTAVEGLDVQVPQPPVDSAPISWKELEGGAYYVQWDMFDDELYKIAHWEKLLQQAQSGTGLIIDMRHNGGGALAFMNSLASYLFTAEEPAKLHWTDTYVYDDKAGDLVKEFSPDQTLSSPKPELVYSGPVVVLVGEGSASAAEYFPQFLQRQGRAVVAGERGTEGAGGPVETALMPGGISFWFTKGRTYFAGTEELNLEAKGVTLDVRVPITLESELAKQEGRDVVLEAGLAALAEEGARMALERVSGKTWQMFLYEAASRAAGGVEKVSIQDPTAYAITFAEDGQMAIQADCNQAKAVYTIGSGGMLKIEVGPTTLAACPEGSLSENFLTALNHEFLLQTDGQQMVLSGVDESGGPIALLFVIAESPESATAEPSAGDLPADLLAQLDAWLNSQAVADPDDAAGVAPGLVLLAETPEGRYLGAAGVSNLEEGTPMQVDDILEIGSNTKSFTIVLLMQLQEEGGLSLDDKLNKWLPDLAAKIPNGDEITLYQLANHVSGIPDYTTGVIGSGVEDPEKLAQGYTPEELVQFAVENAQTQFTPGEGWSYNNTGYVLLGLVAEAATGKSLSELYQERIFDPLGLKTAVLVEGSPQEGEITSQGYWLRSDGVLANNTEWNASQGWAAGGIAMTAEDLATYAKALASGELFEDPDTLVQMLDFNPAGMASVAPYGLGLFDLGEGYWGHEGTTPAFQSLWYINPEKGNLVVGLSNAGTYSAFAFLNVRNYLEGRAAQPFSGATFYPFADANPESMPTVWVWEQITGASGERDIEPGTMLILQKDGAASARSATCGPVEGTFTVGVPDTIAFDLDASAVTCPAGDPLVELLGLLDAAATWRFEAGGMVVVLEDGTELRFSSL